MRQCANGEALWRLPHSPVMPTHTREKREKTEIKAIRRRNAVVYTIIGRIHKANPLRKSASTKIEMPQIGNNPKIRHLNFIGCSLDELYCATLLYLEEHKALAIRIHTHKHAHTSSMNVVVSIHGAQLEVPINRPQHFGTCGNSMNATWT